MELLRDAQQRGLDINGTDVIVFVRDKNRVTTGLARATGQALLDMLETYLRMLLEDETPVMAITALQTIIQVIADIAKKKGLGHSLVGGTKDVLPN